MNDKNSIALLFAPFVATVFLTACATETKQDASVKNITASSPPAASSSPTLARAHGDEKQSPVASQSTAQTNSAANTLQRPTGTPIDTSAFDTEIARLEAKVKKGDTASEKDLANSYLQRAKALTEAQQYRSALGDYRRTLKHEPTNKDAKAMENQIIAIFQQLGRDAPAQGSEPPPLPFRKQ